MGLCVSICCRAQFSSAGDGTTATCAGDDDGSGSDGSSGTAPPPGLMLTPPMYLPGDGNGGGDGGDGTARGPRHRRDFTPYRRGAEVAGLVSDTLNRVLVRTTFDLPQLFFFFLKKTHFLISAPLWLRQASSARGEQTAVSPPSLFFAPSSLLPPPPHLGK